ncbi:orotidine-5'-phosphate decarboxylase [Alkalithermobacter thermoalcaliphilus JW-YL-7 = DSM 7308]|uniref:Orotidine 5'-phosphate decarboxylase n=1 Tax=Alkalithermobacter thermoalcaliphilus JW-YL-7 = DSM 7308 TaxID=1121328 RepID=A0A150FNG1_CLOPD|nr:Orotidine 5'-phosphate decarboxylase [[Clostridium] paradoxum JW-YL-7 = DSM 7308]SHK89826.1 orotidine-5'-phosphate decarboxylase [[Clostridium] paradoxum JW-YL-7 = DSM 7308]
MIIDRLYENVIKKGPVCVGLDTRLEYIPEYILNSTKSIEDKIFEFNKSIIDATIDVCSCYKLQIACYEALGIQGLLAYSKTLKYIKSLKGISIADVKRSDISSSAKMYAKAHFEGDFESDFITLNPYMGQDSITPYLEYVKNKNKGIFVLMKTSNEGSKDFQELKVDDEKLYVKVGEKITSWSSEYIGESGFSSIGAVVGGTHFDEMINIKNRFDNMFFLIPGYGAQGGSAKDISNLLGKNISGVVNSSRGIITAHKGKEEGVNFSEFSRKEVINMRGDILKWLK